MNDQCTYDHYIGVDWANTNMVVARITQKRNKLHVRDLQTNIKELKVYLDHLKGTKILTFEETTPAHWLFTQLRDCVDEIIVCDPRRNKLLSEGPKTDPIDAKKLAELLKGGYVKAVYHEDHHFIYLRKLVSGYQDAVKALVRLKNQRSAILRSVGKLKKEAIETKGEDRFVFDSIARLIAVHEAEIAHYHAEFRRLCKKHKQIRDLMTIPGIGMIGAVKIVAYVVDARRFKAKGKFHSYCGLIRHDRISGGKKYGTRKPKYNRTLKQVFDAAAVSIIGARGRHPLHGYYTYLLKEKRCATHNARRGLSRKVATIALSVMKSGQSYNPKGRKTETQDMS